MTAVSFADLGLSGRLLKPLDALAYRTPTPIQAQAIPILMAKKDLLGIAQTGTGKTAAFSLPLLHHLAEERERVGRGRAGALILAPTRELAIQIVESLNSYGRDLGLRVTTVIGGVGKGPQIAALRRGVDVLVATPGRLLDLTDMGCVDLGQTRHLVVDEADRMFDMGFIRDVRKIVAMLPKRRQTALFSATMPGEIAHLAQHILNSPAKVEIASQTVTVDRVQQSVHHFHTPAAKRARLLQLLVEPDAERVIVFTRTKRGADKVAKHLASDGLGAEVLHGNKTQSARKRALDNFRGGRSRVLVATDIAARGIDVENVTHVINYELPDVPEDYVHRVGRTARAGASGVAISFCDATERSKLTSIERQINQSLAIAGGEASPGYDPMAASEQTRAVRSAPKRNRRRRHRSGNRQPAAT
ncbi:MAG: DEAD/DEAH box helicase [Alphaproteobacteria bacterium]